SYPRINFINAPLAVVATYALEANKKLIFANEGVRLHPSTNVLSTPASTISNLRITSFCAISTLTQQ
ncbi:MAG: hypothetical protein ACRD8U_24940, partial [Pyrinomonadaceae bacterium]